MLYEWDTVGHEQNLGKLEQEIKSGTVSHAYLFSGPTQTGKFRIARIFAQILQCDQNFCQICDTCKKIRNDTHPDTIVLDDDGNTIRIDKVRELIYKTNLTHGSKYRIVLIKNLERMPIEAQNSFLKTLEEPAGKTIFIMTTSQITKILPTIQSRVRHYYFPNLSDDKLRSYLKTKFGEHSKLEEIISMSQGRPGLAICLMQNTETLIHQQSLYNQIEYFLQNNNIAQKFTFIDDLTKDSKKDSKKVDLFLDAFTRYLRKLLFEFMNDKNHPMSKRWSANDLVELFEYLEKSRYLIQRNVNKKLVLENLLLKTEKNKNRVH